MNLTEKQSFINTSLHFVQKVRLAVVNLRVLCES